MGRQTTFLAVLVLVLGCAGGARAQCDIGGGTPVQQGCDGVSYEGCCDSQDLYWCEQGWLCTTDCSVQPLCGWRNAANFYACDTDGNPAPGNNPPMDCPAQDGDGDGYTTDQGDCDDTNQWINPGAAENCVNGVDDDCDGAIDTNDTDCPQGDDDDAVGDDDDHVGDDDDQVGDDDQQHGDDDDTVGPFGDDDDTSPGGNNQQQFNENPHLGIVCGCRTADRTPASPALVLLLMIGIVAVRRLR
jgi:MYXO-CTERM domain-containing protein